MKAPIDEWQARIDLQWRRLDIDPPDVFVAAIDALAAERPGTAAAFFERAAARDSTGAEEGAEDLYRAALANGDLDEYRTVRARLQLASTLRNLGRLDESERLLIDALDGATLRDEARALLALTWIAQGRAVEAAALALIALAPHLTRYQRSTRANAEALLDAAGATPATAFG